MILLKRRYATCSKSTNSRRSKNLSRKKPHSQHNLILESHPARSELMPLIQTDSLSFPLIESTKSVFSEKLKIRDTHENKYLIAVYEVVANRSSNSPAGNSWHYGFCSGPDEDS